MYPKTSDMIIGVISEGHADRAVIANILTGLTGLDRTDVLAIRPEYSRDETDKAKDPKTFSTWSVVKEECERRDKIDDFLALNDHDFVVIHLDTAEASLYGVTPPSKNAPDYSGTLRKLVINQINRWLKDDISSSILYAIAIEEMEAWILPIYEKRDSSRSAKPKEKLTFILAKKQLNSTSSYDNFLTISKTLSKKRLANGLLKYNSSLKAFFDEIEVKVLPNL